MKQHPADSSILPRSTSCYAVYAHSFKLALHMQAVEITSIFFKLPRQDAMQVRVKHLLWLMTPCCYGDRYVIMKDQHV